MGVLAFIGVVAALLWIPMAAFMIGWFCGKFTNVDPLKWFE